MFRKLLLVLLVVVGLAVIAFAVLLVITPAAPVPEQPPPKRSEEHTSELQSLTNLVCRLLLEKKKQRPGSCAPGEELPKDNGVLPPANDFAFLASHENSDRTLSTSQ